MADWWADCIVPINYLSTSGSGEQIQTLIGVSMYVCTKQEKEEGGNPYGVI